jgi:mRNA-degrading endonuclease toxin of MazEF toxin-antitoxin module
VRLQIFSSTGNRDVPNLVGLQHPALSGLPTQLVCPVRAGISLTPLRVEMMWGEQKFVIACDLIRPIRSTALKPLGRLDLETSHRVLVTFNKMLPPI